MLHHRMIQNASEGGSLIKTAFVKLRLVITLNLQKIYSLAYGFLFFVISISAQNKLIIRN